MRLIDIEAMLKAAELAGKEYVSIDLLKDFEQVDAVPVVRCKDCKHFAVYQTRRNRQTMQFCMRMAKHDMEYHINPDDYCSYGAKMEDKP